MILQVLGLQTCTTTPVFFSGGGVLILDLWKSENTESHTQFFLMITPYFSRVALSKLRDQGWGCDSVIEHLPSMCKALS
jgi:hypothetical protein